MSESLFKLDFLRSLRAYQWAVPFVTLCKPKVVALLLLTAVVGMFLAVHGPVPWALISAATLGIGFAAASAAVINHVLDARFDRGMRRTERRPLPQNTVAPNTALAWAVLLGMMGEGLLFYYVNAFAAILTFIALIGYAGIYTVYLKHATPQNIVIGGASGAAPPLLGWVAITGQVEAEALILFMIVFLWTPPHFWALAIHRQAEYAKVGIPMLPVTHGAAFTREHILYYTVLLVLVSLLPYMIGMSGLVYLVAAIILGARYLHYGVRMLREPDNARLPMKSFGFSIVYLGVLFVAMLADHYWLVRIV